MMREFPKTEPLFSQGRGAIAGTMAMVMAVWRELEVNMAITQVTVDTEE